MGDQGNYAALDWVLGEIEETLSDARRALEAYVENPKDTTQLRFCVTHIHQVRGSLQIVEFKGASLLAEQMEQLSQDLVDGKIKKPDDAYEVLMHALLQLPIYLDHVRVYRDDSTRPIMPLLNDIRAVQNKSYLTETNLFNPNLSSLEEIRGRRHPVLSDTQKVKQVTGKLREMYQFAAASVLRGIKVQENLAYLEKVFSRLISLTAGTRSAPLWLIASALIEGLKHDNIEVSIAVKGLLRHLARELRLLAEQAPGSFDTAPRESLIKNLLYYIASAEGDTPLVNQVRKEYALSESLTDDDAAGLPVDGYSVNALDPEAVRSVVLALREELKSIKSILDNIITAQQSPSELREVQPVVKRVADTLAVLGISELREKMLLQADELEELSKRESLDEATLVASAQHIIDVDSKLEAISKSVDTHRDLNHVNEQKIEITEAKLAVIRECQIGLEKAKEAIIEYISSQWDRSHLEDIDSLLRDIRGGMDMVPLTRAGAIVDGCSQFIVEQLIGNESEPSWDTLELLADAMASVEYFLERLSKDMNEDSGSLLGIAEESLAKLGYGPAIASIDVAEPETSEAASDEAEARFEQGSELAVQPETTTPIIDEVAPNLEAPADSSDESNIEPAGEELISTLDDEDSDEVDDEIIEVFIEEAAEVQETLTEYVPKWLGENHSDEDLNVVRRAFHTLKGSGRMVEALDIGELAWSIENMLNRVIDNSVELLPEHGDLVENVTRILPAMTSAFKEKVPYAHMSDVETLSRWAFSLAEGVRPDDFAAQSLVSSMLSAGEPTSAEVTSPSAEDTVPAENIVVDSNIDEFAEIAEAQDEGEDYALLEIFTSEVESHLSLIREFIAEMDMSAPIYTPPTDELQRALHTLKGSAKMAQVVPMGRIYEALEAFAKEMVTFQVSVTDDILQLMRDSVSYSETVIEQIRNRQRVVIDQIELFLARTAELRENAVGHLVRMKELEKDGGKPVDPRLLSIFMAEEMTLLLDADEVVDQWCRDVNSEQRIPALVAELRTLSEGADQAKLPDMSSLAMQLVDIYGHLLQNLSWVDENAHMRLRSAHDALLDMVDAVAAGQNVVAPDPALLEATQHYIDELNARLEAPLDEATGLDSEAPDLPVVEEGWTTNEGDFEASSDIPPHVEALSIEVTEHEVPQDYSAHDEGLEDNNAYPSENSSERAENNAVSDGYSPDVDAETQEIETASSDFEMLEPAESVVAEAAPELLDEIDADADDFDGDILEVFIEEADELLEALDESIHGWESEQDLTQVEEMKRALHTMKGGARLSGLPVLGDLIHDYETFLIELKSDAVGEHAFTRVHDFQDRLLNGISAVKAYLGHSLSGAGFVAPASADADVAADDTTSPPLDETKEVSNILPFEARPRQDAEFPDLLSGEGPAPGQASVTTLQAKKSGPQEVVRVNSELLEELVNLAGETSISRARLEEQVGEFRSSLDEVDATILRLQEQLRRLDIETEAQILFRQEQMAVHEESFDPLEMDRYSQLQQLSRSLIESASDLNDLRSDLSDKLKDTETTLLQQSRVNTTLQEGLMRSRMVPFSRMVPRLRRIVRQVASELGKKVSFELDNVEGELDRSVLERMIPPFEHMLRNAVDHGIEDPEERVNAGKPESGRIVLTLGREGGNVSIRLADDGRGIDLERVRTKAIERGLMDADAQLSDYDIMQFILHAGFSTAENVTQISGRGVGMDVVHSEIKQLGGDVVINSEKGKGTEFVIRLPFTLSVNRALMVNIGQDNFAIPLNTIEGIVRISPFELEHYYSNPDAEFEYANDQYKVRYLGSLLYPGRKANLEGHALPLPIVLVRTQQHTMALQVDALMGSREIVVKNLGAQFSSVQGLSGATVMGDGSVVIILDPHALVRQELAKSDLLLGAAAAQRQRLDLLADESRRAKKVDTIMVVDDSVTVRKVTTRLLEREGYNVITAKDGVEALQILQDETPDVMLLDIEMPRMDGFELAKNLRTSQRWGGLPIIMITSRTGDKHREHAKSLGVNQYMGKPFQEDKLLENIREFVGAGARA